MNFNLPKKYLSYSALNLWWRDKDAYRRRYYENERTPDNVYTLFGREVHEMLETDHHLINIPRFPKREIMLEAEIGGVPVMGYLDGFDPDDNSILDYKTSMKEWTQLDVEKLDQLPFYAMLVKANYKKLPKMTHIVWLETRWKQVEEKVGSVVMEGDGSELELSGRFETFDRKIGMKEVERMKARVVESAREISSDYQRYLVSSPL